MDVLHSGSLIDGAEEFMSRNRPTLDEVLGAACETYSVDPDEISFPRSLRAQRVYCYLCSRWAREPLTAIGNRIGLPSGDVDSMSRSVAQGRLRFPSLRDDLDLLTVRIAERIMLRKRNWGVSR
jgi:hypothetical protein